MYELELNELKISLHLLFPFLLVSLGLKLKSVVEMKTNKQNKCQCTWKLFVDA